MVLLLLSLRQTILLLLSLSLTTNIFDSLSSSSSSSSYIIAVKAITGNSSHASAPVYVPASTTTIAYNDDEDDNYEINDSEDATTKIQTQSNNRMKIFHEMYQKISKGNGFIAALDQSGGSTPKALQSYGMNPTQDNYEDGTESMYDAVHKMRTRIITNPSFNGDKVIGAILFENTMNRQIKGLPTCQYLWERKGIVPFLKIDRGLIPVDNNNDSVQLMKYIPELELKYLLRSANGSDRFGISGGEGGVLFGTKARSFIRNGKNPRQIKELVQQQFDLARLVLKERLVPIIEPEIDIHASDKELCEGLLCSALLVELDRLHVLLALKEEQHFKSTGVYKKYNNQVMIKLTLPENGNQYHEVINHPCCLRVIALSGGYNQKDACEKLSSLNNNLNTYMIDNTNKDDDICTTLNDNENNDNNSGSSTYSSSSTLIPNTSNNIIASFSRAFVEGLQHTMSNDEFTVCISESIDIIYGASASCSTSQIDRSD